MRVGALVGALAALTLACGGGERAEQSADTALLSGDSSVRRDTSAASGATYSDPSTPHADTGATRYQAGPPPTVLLASDSAAGEALYRGRGRCISCHGTRGEGVARLGPALRDSSWVHGDGSVVAIEQTILDGVAIPRQASVAMPSYGAQLTASEARQMAIYVYALSHPGVVQPDSAAGATSPAPGAPSDTTRP